MYRLINNDGGGTIRTINIGPVNVPQKDDQLYFAWEEQYLVVSRRIIFEQDRVKEVLLYVKRLD